MRLESATSKCQSMSCNARTAPSLPVYVIDATKPSCAAWTLNARILPLIYWEVMVLGRKWMSTPEVMT